MGHPPQSSRQTRIRPVTKATAVAGSIHADRDHGQRRGTASSWHSSDSALKPVAIAAALPDVGTRHRQPLQRRHRWLGPPALPQRRHGRSRSMAQLVCNISAQRSTTPGMRSRRGLLRAPGSLVAAGELFEARPRQCLMAAWTLVTDGPSAHPPGEEMARSETFDHDLAVAPLRRRTTYGGRLNSADRTRLQACPTISSDARDPAPNTRSCSIESALPSGR